MLHAFGCEAATGSAQIVAVSSDDLLDGSSGSKVAERFASFGARACEPHARNGAAAHGSILSIRGDRLTEHDYDLTDDPLTLAAGTTWPAWDLVDLDVLAGTADPWVALARSDEAEIVTLDARTGESLALPVPSSSAVAVSAMGTAGGVAYAAWIDDLGQVGILLGVLGSDEDCWDTTWPLTPPFPAEHVAIWAPDTDPPTLVIAVTGSDELALGAAQVQLPDGC
jgi:hypothetical protein